MRNALSPTTISEPFQLGYAKHSMKSLTINVDRVFFLENHKLAPPVIILLLPER